MLTTDRVRAYVQRIAAEHRQVLDADGYVPRVIYPEGADPAQAHFARQWLRSDAALSAAKSDSELTSMRRVALIGNAGAGKSFILQHAYVRASELCETEPEAPTPVWFDLGWVGSKGDLTAALDARTNGAWADIAERGERPYLLFIDRLDELIVEQLPRFGNDLWAFLRGVSAQAVGVFIGCRRALWQRNWLDGLNPPFEVYHADYLSGDEYVPLLPDAAQRHEFRRKCSDAGLQALLNTPFDGFYLARRFGRDGTVLQTRREIIRQRVDDALERYQEGVCARPPLATLTELTRSLAALATFTDLHTWTEPEAVDALCPGADPVAGPSAVGRLLRTPLFIRDGGRFRFVHDLFREFLAAEALRPLPVRKQRQLLQTSLQGRSQIVPAHRGVAMFLAEMSEPFLRHLLEADPLAAFMADTGCLNAQSEERLTLAVVRKCVDEGRTPFRSVTSRGDEPRDALRRHAVRDVPTFVVPLLQSPDPIARWWGLACVETWGAPAEALPVLSDLAFDTAMDGSTREHAAIVITASGSTEAIRGLYPLLTEGDDWVRGPVLRAYRETEDPSPSEYIEKLIGGLKDESLVGLLKREVSEYGRTLGREGLAEAFAAVGQHFGGLGALRCFVLAGLFAQARELQFIEVPPDLIVRLWDVGRGAVYEHYYGEALDALVSEQEALFDRIWEFSLAQCSDSDMAGCAWTVSRDLGRLCSDHIFDLLPPPDTELSEAQSILVSQTLGAHWSKAQTEERLRVFRRRAPGLFARVKLRPPPRPTAPRDPMVDCARVIAAVTTAGGDAVRASRGALVAIGEIVGKVGFKGPTVQQVRDTLSRLGPYVRLRVLLQFGECVRHIQYARKETGDGRFSITPPQFETMFWVLRLEGRDAGVSKAAQIAQCYAFSSNDDAARDYDDLLEDLRARDAALWRSAAEWLLENRPLQGHMLVEYLVRVKADFYAPRCAQRLREGDFSVFELDDLLLYLEAFRKDDYSDVLRECYAVLCREFPHRSGERECLETPQQTAPSRLSDREAVLDWWKIDLCPLVLLMEDDDDWAWRDFAVRVAAGDVPVSDHDAIFNTLRSIKLPGNPAHCRVLADWYALVRNASRGEQLYYHNWSGLAMQTIRATGGHSAVQELRRLREENAFPGAEWLGHEILQIEDDMLSAERRSKLPSELVSFIRTQRAAIVDTDYDLFETVCGAVEDVAAELEEAVGVDGFWDNDTPKPEPGCQNVLWPRLHEKLRHLAVVQGEEWHIGANRSDLWVEMPRAAGTSASRVCLELKTARERYGPSRLLTPIEKQLWDQQVRPSGIEFGIYIVLWFKDPERYDHPTHWATAEDLAADIGAECTRVSQERGVALAGYVLDLTKRPRRH